jgi:dihydrofolate synthase/folylpolyglutamate synthase
MSYNRIMSLAAAENFLAGQRRLGIKLGLRNMAAAMKAMGHPERGFPSVLVGGSKGKGSLCAFLTAILEAAGHRTGMFTSPHLIDVRERICVGGSPLSGREFARALDGVRNSLGGRRSALTYFEWLTAMAIRHFADGQVDIAVFEVGLGGRCDATNIVPAGLSIVTEIEKEHTEYLGTTLLQIAREKGGIIKEGGAFCSGVTSPSARRGLAALARERGVVPRWLDRAARWSVTGHSPGGLRMNLELGSVNYGDLSIGLLGRHQARNAALAVLAVEELRGKGFEIGEDDVREGLFRARWPGRCDYRPGNPAFFLDGAHTPSSARALASTLEELFPRRRRVLLFGALKDKKVRRLADTLFPGFCKVVLVRPPEERGLSPRDLLRRLAPAQRRVCLPAAGIGEAFDLAVGEAGPSGLVVAAGSLFLVGAVLGRLPTARGGAASPPGRPLLP